MVKIGMMLGERYEILEKIGTGGMSDVYKAKCHKLNRFVAVKVLKQEFGENANFVSKFRIEAQAAAGLMHPNIVNVYDVGEENGILLIASAMGGAIFVMLCDLLARVLFAPFEIPVGIVLSFAGAPFFLWLLFKQRGGRT